MRKTKLLNAGILFLTAAAAALFLFRQNPRQEEAERKSVSQFTAATFEYAGDVGYKLITSEIGTLSTFDSLILAPSEESFKGDWIYRITFNPKSIMPNSTEYIILFGEHNLSINGQTYTAGDGVDYSAYLNWASAKYKFFDYELLPEQSPVQEA